jgi:hypothetical protein
MTGTVRLQGRDIQYVVRQSARARRLSLRIRDASGVEVIVPARLKLHGVESVLQRKAPWIVRTLERIAHHQSSGPLATLEDGMRLPLLGEELTLRIVRVTGRRTRVSSSNGELVVSLPFGGSGDIRLPLTRWYFARAKDTAPCRRTQQGVRIQLRNCHRSEPEDPLGKLLPPWEPQFQLAAPDPPALCGRLPHIP